MEKRGILAAGNWIVDIVKKLDRFPNEGELCNINSSENGGGGGPCNVLFDLAAMRCDIPLFAAGMLGNDAPGKWLLNEITRRQINADFMKISPESSTSYTDVMSAGTRRTFFHCRGANSLLSYNDLCNFPENIKIFYLGYLLLLDKLDGIDPEYGTPAARLLKEVQAKGIMTLVDFVTEDKEKFLRVTQAALPYIDVLAINEIEAGNTFNLEIRRSDDSIDLDKMEQALHRFIEAGVKKMAIIHMPEGSCAIDANHKIVYGPSCRISHSEIVGSNGAGDAFCAGVLYGLHENLPIETILKFSAASSYFNLHSATASGGAVELAKILRYVQSGEYRPCLK